MEGAWLEEDDGTSAEEEKDEEDSWEEEEDGSEEEELEPALELDAGEEDVLPWELEEEEEVSEEAIIEQDERRAETTRRTMGDSWVFICSIIREKTEKTIE